MADRYYSTLRATMPVANTRLYGACAKLSEADYLKPRASFFGSIHATLNHLMGRRPDLARRNRRAAQRSSRSTRSSTAILRRFTSREFARTTG